MENIRIDTGTKRIQINDGPEFIEFDPTDVDFAEKFYDLVIDFENKQVEYTQRADNLKTAEKDEQTILANTAETISLVKEICEYMNGQIDKVFGENTSKKCFGSHQSLVQYIQFFQGIVPIISTVRDVKITKYLPHPHKKVSKTK